MMKESNSLNLEKIYQQYIEDVAMEISIDKKFRDRLLNATYGEQLEISQKTANHCKYLNHILSKGLVFMVEKVYECTETFDSDLTIFKFSAKDFPNIIRYTGNNI